MSLIKYAVLPVIVVATFAQAPAWAHAGLESATPAKNAVLTAAPSEVSLHFSEAVEQSFSSIKVIDATGHDLVSAKATPDKAMPAMLHAPLGKLTPGRYTVRWVAAGHDGHRRTGEYIFSVK